MNSALVKGSAAFAATSGAATMGAYFSGAFSKEDNTFRKYLSSIGREIASSGDWEKIKELYASAENKDLIEGIQTSNVSAEAITRWCDGKLNSEYLASEKNLIEAWCSKPVSIINRLSHFKLSALNTTNTDDGVWDTKAGSYSADIAKDSSLKANEINDSQSTKTLGSELTTATKEKLKKWCDWAKEQSYQYEESVLFKRYKHWCVRSKD
ncbi:hypothetical protein MHF_0712 [Mycoplasma haemofelis Ohio2]|uniref:Uncharacterized protein n=1 Tax=Mycoplasma haemofelis (strain Ohio2) TaxID=859194 RepID=F6FID4_MYCHI|nr:hypothetical protein MHF_0712 [Mycoplasma haemofelis Ohio2]